MKNKFMYGFTFLVVSILITSCSFRDILPGVSTDSQVDNSLTNGIQILATSDFIDGTTYNIIGEISNNLSSPATSIELSISITDTSGVSLLKDENGNTIDDLSFYPMLGTIDSGKTSPFLYSFDISNGNPANYNVTILGYQSGLTPRGSLLEQNIQIINDGNGNFVLTGELVNQTTQWVIINNLVGGVRDDANIVLSAAMTGTFAKLLAPAGEIGYLDRTPFYITFPIPMADATQWSVWWDAGIATEIPGDLLTAEVKYSYFDEYGSAHLVGSVTNNSDTTLISTVIAGLYAEDGTVLDASYSTLVLPILPGTERPFDIAYFGSVNTNEEQAALVNSFDVKVDYGRTYPSLTDTVGLTPINETIQKIESTWTVTGNFANTTTNELSGVTVMAAVYDPAGTLVAMGYTYSFPAGDTSYAPGDSDSYEIYIYLDPVADTTGYTTQTYIVADLAE
jgi:hypothetical protein